MNRALLCGMCSWRPSLEEPRNVQRCLIALRHPEQKIGLHLVIYE
jgi:hypothetical protein